MTIQTPITELDDIMQQIECQQRRSAALAQLHAGIHALKTAPIHAQQGDLDAERLVAETLRPLILALNPIDIDIINRLLENPDYFALARIAGDAKSLHYHIDAEIIDRLECRAAAIRRRESAGSADAYRAKQIARKTAYTRTYEAAMKLPASKRRQLAEALLES